MQETAVNGAAEDENDAQRKETQYWLMKAEPESRIVKGKVHRVLALINSRM